MPSKMICITAYLLIALSECKAMSLITRHVTYSYISLCSQLWAVEDSKYQHKIDLSSKLGRKLAYKKKLEEEYRLEEERRKYEKSPTYSGYRIREVDVLKEQEILETGKKEQHEKYQQKIKEKSEKYKAVTAKFYEMKNKNC